MFDIGWSELLVIGVVALIVIGPKELPGVLRAVGHWMGKVRRMASEFQDQFREAMREAEVADLKRQFDEASAKATSAFTNPLEVAQKEVDAAFGSDPTVLDKPADTPADTPAIASADSGATESSVSAPAEAPLQITPEPAIAEAEGSADHVKPGGSGAA